MSGSEAEKIFNALKEMGQKIALLDKNDILILDEDDRDELYEIIVFMDDRFASF